MDLKELLKKIKLSEQTISIILGGLVVIVIGILIFNYFRGVSKKATPEETLQPGQVNLVEEEGKLVPEGLPTTHKVEKGENLWSIALKYFDSGYNWVDIARENKLKEPNKLLVGQELTIPKAEVKKPLMAQAQKTETISGTSYNVVKGDNLWKIAVRAYGDGYKWVEIARENNLGSPNLIHPGNELSLPR